MSMVGSGRYQYQIIEDWAKLPEGWQFGILVGVAVDSQDRVYVCHQRQEPPIIVFDRDGNYICSWGEGEINEGHIMTIDADDSMYLVDRGAHQALRLRLDGERLMELGRKGYPSNTGLTEIGGYPRQAAGPFNMPTRMFSAPSGDIYVSDGYRNARVHRFSEGGDLISSWGAPGKDAPGEFHLPHSLWVDSEGLVYVCDRKNNRVQIFSPEGEYVSQWVGLTSPVDICMDGDEKRVCTRRRHGRRVAAHHGAGQVRERSGAIRHGLRPPRSGWTPTATSTWQCAGSSGVQKFVRQG